MEEDLFPDPCAYVNQTRRALKAAAADSELSVAACADAFVARITALEAHNTARCSCMNAILHALE